MSLFKPTELRRFLRQHGIHPDKSLSQNFLVDGNVIAKIVAEAQVEPGDLVLEIGPGPGALTEALLAAGAHVLAVEKDRKLAAALPRLKEGETCKGKLEVVEGDFMHFPLNSALKQRLQNDSKAKVVANLPYQLTTPILQRLIPERDVISDVVVMVQDEVARRMVAKPRTREFNSLALFLAYYSTVGYAFKVSRNSFYPAPKVDSAIAHLTLHQPPQVSDEDAFFVLTRTAFGTRRKMLRRSLKELYGSQEVEASLSKLGLPTTARPEELSLELFLQLFESLSS